jgi:hypothetical protein
VDVDVDARARGLTEKVVVQIRRVTEHCPLPGRSSGKPAGEVAIFLDEIARPTLGTTVIRCHDVASPCLDHGENFEPARTAA